MIPCLVCHRLPVQAHHVRTRGAGGTYRHLVPLCLDHHTQWHTKGPSSLGSTKEWWLEMAEMIAQAWERLTEGTDDANLEEQGNAPP